MPIVDRLTSVPDVVAPPGLPHAVTVSGTLAFVTGQLPLDGDAQLVGAGDLGAQAAQVLRNVHGIVRALGADWPDVVRLGWYVLDATAIQLIRDVRDEFIQPSLGDRPGPASSLVQVAALVRPDCLVEVDAVVALPG